MPELPVVDENERKRIREALKSYKAQHGDIGDTRLQQRMVSLLDKIDRPYLDLSSLQRFIRGKGRTEDTKVRRYRKFLRAVAPPLSEDVLGQALADYVSPLLFIKGWEGFLAGEYRCALKQRSAGSQPPTASAATAEALPPSFEMLDHELRLEAAGNAPYLRAAEVPSAAHDDNRDDNPPPGMGRKGVLLPFNDTDYLLLLRSYLDTQIYLLRKASDAPLTLRGQTYTPTGAIDESGAETETPWEPATEVILIKKDLHPSKSESREASDARRAPE